MMLVVFFSCGYCDTFGHHYTCDIHCLCFLVLVINSCGACGVAGILVSFVFFMLSCQYFSGLVVLVVFHLGCGVEIFGLWYSSYSIHMGELCSACVYLDCNIGSFLVCRVGVFILRCSYGDVVP